MRPSEGLSNLSPNQVLFNKNPPSYFGQLSIKEEEVDYVSKDVYNEHREHIQALHLSQAKNQLTKFFLKSNFNEGTLKEKDIVILRDPSNNAFHSSSQRGPWYIHKVKTRNNFEITHIFNRNKLVRQGKYLVKLNLDEYDSKYLRETESIFVDQKTREIINSNYPTKNKTLSPLAIDYSHLKTSTDDTTTSRYALRSKK